MFVIIPLWPFFVLARWTWRLTKWCARSIWARLNTGTRRKGEFYTADIWQDDKHIRRSTFFPSTWTELQVSDSIREAFDDFKSKGSIDCAIKGNKSIARGLTKEGIEIEMHFDLNGELLTAYPIF